MKQKSKHNKKSDLLASYGVWNIGVSSDRDVNSFMLKAMDMFLIL